MNFSQALEHLKAGRFMRRRGWYYPNQYVKLSNASAFVVCLQFKDVPDFYMPWFAQHQDLLAGDWQAVENNEDENFNGL